MIRVHLVVRWQVLAKLKLVLVILKIIATLLGRPSGQLVGNNLPIASMLLEQSNELVLLVPLPLVLRLYTTTKERRLVHGASASCPDRCVALSSSSSNRNGVLRITIAVRFAHRIFVI